MTENTKNISVILARRPGETFTEDCLDVIEDKLPGLEDGTVLVQNEYLSCDPYLRLRMNDTFETGKPVPARAVGRVIESRDSRWKVGQQVWGHLSWSKYVSVDPRGLSAVGSELQRPTHSLSVCGPPGLTAYVGMIEKARPGPSDTVVVSGAAGAIGSIAGQLARHAGSRVIGIVGSEVKARYIVDELGFHDVVIRNNQVSLPQQLNKVAPDGIDVCFENVGGKALDASLMNLGDSARIVLCGMASSYDGSAHGVNKLMGLCSGESTMYGLNVAHHLGRLEEISAYMTVLMRNKHISFREDIVTGIYRLPHAFSSMVAGETLGKRLVKVIE